jgi:putative transposase
MKAIKTIKLQIQADTATFASLDGNSKICNWLFNHLLEIANNLKKEFIQTGNKEIVKTLYTKRGLRNLLPKLKQDRPFLKSVHSSPLKNAALRLSSAIQAHQKSKKGKRAGKLMGWPKFRSWKASWFSLLYDEPQKGFKMEDDILTLSSLCEGKSQKLTFSLKESYLLKNQKICNLRITKQGHIYYAIFTIETALPAKKEIKKIIALDPNHKNMVQGVDTKGKSIEVEPPNWLKAYDRRFDELKSKRDRCNKKSKKIIVTDHQGKPIKERWEPSKRWNKYQRALEKAIHKRREQTKTYEYTLAHELCKKYDVIAIGDYAPHGEGITSCMRRAMNNRSLIGRFKIVLKWVAEKSGKVFIEYEEKGTTRTCHGCDYIHSNGLSPKIRVWQCPNCQNVHCRDENSAINGLRKTLRGLQEKGEVFASQVPCSGLFHISERWAWCVLPHGIHKNFVKQNGKKLQHQEIKLKA